MEIGKESTSLEPEWVHIALLCFAILCGALHCFALHHCIALVCIGHCSEKSGVASIVPVQNVGIL